MEISFEGQNRRIHEVPAERKYWFIRTYGGEAYNSYLKGGYVGVGYNDVPFRYIQKATFDEPSSMEALTRYLQNRKDTNPRRISRIANQLVSFNNEVSIGDCVIIPSRNSDILALGTIESDTFLVDKPGTINVNGQIIELPEKRRKVKWQKSIQKDDPRNDIKAVTASHYGITNVSFYSDTIEAIVSSLYIKDQQACLVIQIDQDEEINAFELNRFLSDLTYFYHEFCSENGTLLDEDLRIKIKLQSAGKMLLKAGGYVGILGLATMISLSNNNKLKVDAKNFKVEGSSDGLLKSITDFFDRNEERRERAARFDDSIKNLKANRDTTSKLIEHVTEKSKESRPQEKGKK